MSGVKISTPNRSGSISSPVYDSCTCSSQVSCSFFGYLVWRSEDLNMNVHHPIPPLPAQWGFWASPPSSYAEMGRVASSWIKARKKGGKRGGREGVGKSRWIEGEGWEHMAVVWEEEVCTSVVECGVCASQEKGGRGGGETACFVRS